jgi:hypothetical protein
MVKQRLYTNGATAKFDADAIRPDYSHISAFSGAAEVCLNCPKSKCRGGDRRCQRLEEAKLSAKRSDAL